jgi:hypothetical protein
MKKLPIQNAVRVQSGASASIKGVNAGAVARARPASDMFASLHLLGKSVMVAVEVVEIVGFLALL